MKGKYLKYILTLFVAFVFFACGDFNKILKSSDYELKYTKAIEYYNKANYTSAQTLFEELIPVFKGTDRAEQVYYYYTYCHYYLTDYALAGFHFRTFARTFPNSQHAEECAFMNAYCYYLSSPKYSLDQSDTKNAIQEIQNFLNEYPESKQVDTCNILMDKLRFKLEKKSYEITKGYFFRDDWKAAAPACENFIKDFPESPHNDEMLFMIIKSYYLLAKNSVESKKADRIEKAMENYLKFVDLHPNSHFLAEAESIYKDCERLKTDQQKLK
ncbi:MAG TPA: outer membrane protein assembly factor BamD [Bacteroidia bacterium]|nr:outer membrane protein assembly factor BamD [Bacteroidia bacterium]